MFTTSTLTTAIKNNAIWVAVVPASIYPDPITKASEAPIQSAKSVVFDMSDEQPPSFGATTGQGEWGIFQDFLKTPSDVQGIAKKLEAAAAAAYKKGK